MWLPKSLYELLPLLYALAGVAAAVASQLIADDVYRAIVFAGGVGALIGGVVLILKRRDYRMSRSRLKYDRLDK
jgi:hypothetical protein